MVSKKVIFISSAVTVAVICSVTAVLLINYYYYGPSSEEAQQEYEETLVETKLGKINGSVFYTRLDKRFIGFRGIRYAEAPVGDLRLRVSCCDVCNKICVNRLT